MKDQYGKTLKRDFAPRKRPKPEDQYKTRVVQPNKKETKERS